MWSTRSPEASDSNEKESTSSTQQSNCENTGYWLPRMKLEHVRNMNFKENSPLDSSQEWKLSPGEPGFQKDLVVIALKAIGGVGTLDDVAKWIRKHRPGVLEKHMSRKSISRVLCRQASYGVLCHSKQNDRRQTIYTVPGMVQTKLLQESNGSLSVDGGIKDSHVGTGANSQVEILQLDVVSRKQKTTLLNSSKREKRIQPSVRAMSIQVEQLPNQSGSTSAVQMPNKSLGNKAFTSARTSILDAEFKAEHDVKQSSE